MPDRRVLLFDLGGVLVDSAGLTVLGQRLPHLSAGAIAQRWYGSRTVAHFERGALSEQEFARAFVAEWQLAQEPAAFIAEFGSWVRGFYPGARELLAQLRMRHVVACLSNTNAVHWAQLAAEREAFDLCIASHLIGHLKPEPAAYRRALERLGDVDPGQVIFFDDLPANVEAARAAGLQAFRVRGVEETTSVLRELGVLPPSTG